MILDVLISKYSGVVHTIQAFPSVISPYDIVLCHSSIGAIPATFEIFVSKKEEILNFYRGNRFLNNEKRNLIYF